MRRRLPSILLPTRPPASRAGATIRGSRLMRPSPPTSSVMKPATRTRARVGTWTKLACHAARTVRRPTQCRSTVNSTWSCGLGQLEQVCPERVRADQRRVERVPVVFRILGEQVGPGVAVERLPGVLVPLQQVGGRKRDPRSVPPIVVAAGRPRSGSCGRRPSRGRRRRRGLRAPASRPSPRRTRGPRPGCPGEAGRRPLRGPRPRRRWCPGRGRPRCPRRPPRPPLRARRRRRGSSAAVRWYVNGS